MLKTLDSKGNRLYGLDHLRALAIILVMVFHYNQGVPRWLGFMQRFGWTGVDLFFVLSGYLIGYQLLREIKTTQAISLKNFYIRRFFRIIPSFLVVLIVYYSLGDLREGNGLPPLLKFLTFTQNFGLDVQHGKTFSHAWSLCIEEQFYLLLPVTILFLFYRKLQGKSGYIIAGLLLIVFVTRMFNWYCFVEPFRDNNSQMVINFMEKVYYPTYNRMDGLLIGLGIAAIFVFRPKLTKRITSLGNYFLAGGFGLLVAAYFVCNTLISANTAIYGFLLVSIAYGFIVIGAISPGCILYKYKSRVTYHIAGLSYVIYLTHKQVFHLVRIWFSNKGFDQHGDMVFWVCIAMAFLVGLVMHLIVEKPFYALRDKVLSKIGLL